MHIPPYIQHDTIIVDYNLDVHIKEMFHPIDLVCPVRVHMLMRATIWEAIVDASDPVYFFVHSLFWVGLLSSGERSCFAEFQQSNLN